MTSIEASLRRLRIESIDLYYIHWPDPTTPLAETMEAVAQCQQDGKIKHVGVSNFSASQIREAHDVVRLTAVQVEYSLLHRVAENAGSMKIVMPF